MRKYYAIFKVFLIFMIFEDSTLSASTSILYSSEVEAVIFDCDGVLVDTEYLKFLAWQEALASKNIVFVIEEYRPLVGHSSKNILFMLKQLKNIDIPEEVIDLKNAKYRTLQKQGVSPIKEVVAFARRLIEKKQHLGIKVGVASSAPSEEIFQNLRQIGLENAFDLIISGSDDLDSYADKEGKNKPKPYIYIEAAKRLNVSPSKCLVFEDTTAGIEAATTAGMIAVAIPNRFTSQQDFSKAVKVIGSYRDLPTFKRSPLTRRLLETSESRDENE
jgi:beta-phosphoglucomutase